MDNRNTKNTHGDKRAVSNRKETSQIGKVKSIVIRLDKEEIESLNRWAKQEGLWPLLSV